LIDVNEVDCGKTRERHFESEYGWVLLYRHKVSVLEDVCEHEDLQEYGAA
jgi:hypothetical protein